MKSTFAFIAAAVTLTACAPNPAAVAPTNMTGAYNGMSCQQAAANLPQARANEAALTQRQSNAAITDAATVFLVLIPVSSLTGQNVEGELAAAKGTVDALESRLIGC